MLKTYKKQFEDYVPDMTERYPDGMYDSDFDTDDYPDPSDLQTVDDLIKEINNSDDYYNKIIVYTMGTYNTYRKEICELSKADELSRFSGDLVGKWGWHDDKIIIDLAYYDKKHIHVCESFNTPGYITEDILNGKSVRDVIFNAIKESEDFKKGDIVVAKPEYIDTHETEEDTLGVVIDYNPENDYLVLGSIHPEKYAIAPTYSMRGEYYRLVKPAEYDKFGLSEGLLNENDSSYNELKRELEYNLYVLLNRWGEYIGDLEHWKDIVLSAAENEWKERFNDK